MKTRTKIIVWILMMLVSLGGGGYYGCVVAKQDLNKPEPTDEYEYFKKLEAFVLNGTLFEDEYVKAEDLPEDVPENQMEQVVDAMDSYVKYDSWGGSKENVDTTEELFANGYAKGEDKDISASTTEEPEEETTEKKKKKKTNKNSSSTTVEDSQTTETSEEETTEETSEEETTEETSEEESTEDATTEEITEETTEESTEDSEEASTTEADGSDDKKAHDDKESTTESKGFNLPKKKERVTWVKNHGNTYYYHGGKRVTGYQIIDGNLYFFDKRGVLQKKKKITKSVRTNKEGICILEYDYFDHGKKGLKKLRKQLEEQLAGYSGTWSVYVKNLETNKYMVINDIEMKPASVIKLYNLGCSYEQIEKGDMTRTKAIDYYLTYMIRVSDNSCHNYLLYNLGGGNATLGTNMLNEFCQRQGYTRTHASGTLRPSNVSFSASVGSAQTTAMDCGHILEDIYRGELVSEDASKEMLDLLKSQQRTSKIPAGVPYGVVTANKTGEISGVENDAAIIFSDGADYVITVMVNGDRAAIPHIRAVSSLVYNYFNPSKESKSVESTEESTESSEDMTEEDTTEEQDLYSDEEDTEELFEGQ